MPATAKVIQWSSVAAVVGVIIVLGQAKDAAHKLGLDPVTPALQGWVLDQIDEKIKALALDDTTKRLDAVDDKVTDLTVVVIDGQLDQARSKLLDVQARLRSTPDDTLFQKSKADLEAAINRLEKRRSDLCPTILSVGC